MVSPEAAVVSEGGKMVRVISCDRGCQPESGF